MDDHKRGGRLRAAPSFVGRFVTHSLALRRLGSPSGPTRSVSLPVATEATIRAHAETLAQRWGVFKNLRFKCGRGFAGVPAIKGLVL